MAWYRAGGGGIPSSLKTGMNSVLNKKFGTSTTYDPAGWPDDVNLLGKLPEKTSSGTIANITDGADEVPIKNWLVTLPASLDGYSEVNGVRTGKNLFDGSLFPQTRTATSYYANFAYNSGNIPLIRIKPNTQYTISVDVSCDAEPFNVSVGLGNGTYLTDLATVFNKTSGTISVTFSATSAQVEQYGNILALRAPRFGSSTTFTATISNPMLEVGSAATIFEAYQTPTQYTASLGRTVYGATVDVANGTCSKAITETKTFDGSSDENWQYSASYGWFYIDNQFGDAYRNNTEDDFMACNLGTQTKYSSVTALPDMHFACTSGTNSRFAFKNSQYSTVEAFKEWLSNNNMVVAYTSAAFTPFTFDPITPTPETALGVNNFWADEGDSAVTYRADIDLALGGN